MTAKACSKCGERKALAEFYPRSDAADGRTRQCRACKLRGISARRKTPEGRALKREQDKRWNAAHPEQARATARARAARWQAAHPEQVREAGRKSRLQNPEKARARDAVHHAIEAGRLERRPCETCGAPRAHAHHPDYQKPLAVRFLCPVHHAEAHR